MSMASNNSIHNMSEFKVSLSARYFRDCIRKDRMTSLASNLLMKNHDSFIHWTFLHRSSGRGSASDSGTIASALTFRKRYVKKSFGVVIFLLVGMMCDDNNVYRELLCVARS